MDESDGVDELVRRSGLEQVAACPGLERALDLDVALVSTEHHDPRGRRHQADRIETVHAAHVRQAEIHEGDIGRMHSVGFDPFRPTRSLRHERHVVLDIDDRRESLTKHRMIVHRHDSDHGGHHAPPSRARGWFDPAPRRAASLRYPPSGFMSAYTVRPGTRSTTSVPPPARGSTDNLAPSPAARSRMPGRPQWPS